MSKYQQIPVPPYPGEREPGKESLVKVAALQMEPHVGDKEHNVAASLKMIDEAGEMGVKLMVLPELCNTGTSSTQEKKLLPFLKKFQMAQPHRNGSKRHKKMTLTSVPE